MIQPNEPRIKQTLVVILQLSSACLFLSARSVEAIVYDWDNYSGSSAFIDSFNWRPTGGPPGVGDTALFDGQLENAGLGNNAVNVPDGTAIDAMRVSNSTGFPTTVVDMTIGDGTIFSRFDLDQSFDPLIIGTSPGDTATLNLLGGWLNSTWGATIGGRATFKVDGEGSYLKSSSVRVSGDTVISTAGIELGNQAIISSSSLEIGGPYSGSGRVVIDGTVAGLGTSAKWFVGSVVVGPAGSTGFDFGVLTLQNGGRMDVSTDVYVHGAEVNSTLTVQSGSNLDIAGILTIRRTGVLELADPTSTITTGGISNQGGELDWTGGTLHITDNRLLIEDTVFASLGSSSLTIDSGMTLKVTNASPGISPIIGEMGSGTLTVQNGGVVESYYGYLGVLNGGDGTVDVTGSDSLWTVTEDLGIGRAQSGVGRLNITDGQVTANSIWLGAFDTADGTITVNNGTLTSTAVLAVGGSIHDDGVTSALSGGTGQLVVQDGGNVDVAKTLVVFGGGAVALLDGTISTGSFINDQGGTFTHDDGTLTVNGGTFAPNAGGNYSIDAPDTLKLPTVILTDGASYTSTGTLFVGFSQNGRIEIRNGATVNTLNGRVGWSSGSHGNVIVDGNQSKWINSDDLEIGTRNDGAMVISHGGRVESSYGALGVVAGAAGNVVVESDGIWDISEAMYVGGKFSAGGTGNLFVSDGGRVIVGTGLGSLFRLYPAGYVHLNTGGTIETDTVELVSGAMSNFNTEPDSTLQVNRLLGFGANPTFNGKLILGLLRGQHAGAITVASGELFSAESILVGGDSANLATFTVESGGQVVTTGPAGMVLTATGELTGAGEVVAPTLENGGIVAPGSSAGTLALDGDYTQLAAGVLRIEIGGEIPGLEFDTLFATGAASLDGTLSVSLIDPLGGGNVFVPTANDVFPLLKAIGGLGGTTFATVPADLPALTGALMWDIVYGSDSVELTVLTPFTADFDGDGDVDRDDLTQWQGDFGTDGNSDADDDGDSDGSDFLAWQRQYGGGGEPLAPAHAVPEPGTWLLLLGLIAMGILTRNGRCTRTQSKAISEGKFFNIS